MTVSELKQTYKFINAKNHLILEIGKRPASHVTDDPADIPSLGGKHISNEGFLKLSSMRYISKEYFESVEKGIIKEDDILINKDGANTGKIAFVERLPFEKGMVNEHIFIIRNDGRFDQKFLFYCLYSFEGQKQIKSKIVGSAQGGISNSFIKGIQLPGPDKPIQEKIASIIHAVDKNIEQTRESIKKAERLKKSFMQNLLTGRIKVDGTETLKKENIETKMGLFPKNWNIVTVNQISSQVTDGAHTTPKRSNKGYYLLSARNIKNGFLDLSNVDYIEEDELNRLNKTCKPEYNDLLVSCSGTIGNVCLCPNSIKSGMVRSVALIKLIKGKIIPKYAEILFQSDIIQKQIKIAIASAVQGNIFQGAIKKIKLPLPNTDIQKKILLVFKPIDDKLIFYQNKIKKLKRLKRSLMQNLLTGKIPVKVN
jgi:type I restriction enzyme, S subunit